AVMAGWSALLSRVARAASRPLAIPASATEVAIRPMISAASAPSRQPISATKGVAGGDAEWVDTIGLLVEQQEAGSRKPLRWSKVLWPGKILVNQWLGTLGNRRERF